MTAPPLARSTSNGRVYRHPLTGEEVPSVTTLIKGGLPIPALPRWAAKTAAEYVDEQWFLLERLTSAERIALIKGAPWRSAEAKADRDPKFIENETTVWNRTHGYAGTLDFIAGINGLTTLVDVKTGKGVYAETALQLVALARAEFIIRPDGTEQPMPPLDLLAVLHVRPRSWALIPVTPGEASWEAFLAAKRITEWSRDTAPTVLGARLKEPA